MISHMQCEHPAGEDCFTCQDEQAAFHKALDAYVYGAADTPIRTFSTGATRGAEDGKLDPEGFLSPAVLVRYCQYMDKHRTQADGTKRSSDNWQKGIPVEAYMKSLWRHFLDVWLLHRLQPALHKEPDYNMEEALCAVIFNASGYLDRMIRG